MFCSDGRAHFVCLYSSEKADKLVKEVHARRAIGLKIVKNSAVEFEKREYATKWVNG
jgi:hypothetical protein